MSGGAFDGAAFDPVAFDTDRPPGSSGSSGIGDVGVRRGKNWRTGLEPIAKVAPPPPPKPKKIELPPAWIRNGIKATPVVATKKPEMARDDALISAKIRSEIADAEDISDVLKMLDMKYGKD